MPRYSRRPWPRSIATYVARMRTLLTPTVSHENSTLSCIITARKHRNAPQLGATLQGNTQGGAKRRGGKRGGKEADTQHVGKLSQHDTDLFYSNTRCNEISA